MPHDPIKLVCWIGSSYKDLRAFPDPVQDMMGYALYRGQVGAKHESAKPLKGLAALASLKSWLIMLAMHIAPSTR